MLHGGGIERCADGLDHRGACSAVISEYTNLDQLVAFQVDVDFTQHRRRQAGITDQHHGLQMMRFGFQCAALRRIQGRHADSLTGCQPDY